MPDELEFVPLDEAHPEAGVVVELKIPNPDHAKELAAYREVLERNPFAETHVIEALAPGLSCPHETRAHRAASPEPISDVLTADERSHGEHRGILTGNRARAPEGATRAIWPGP